MFRFLLFLAIFLTLLALNVRTILLPDEEIITSKEKQLLELVIFKLTKEQFILTCTILATVILMLVCVFGLIICCMDENEVKKAERKKSIQMYKMSKLSNNGNNVLNDGH